MIKLPHPVTGAALLLLATLAAVGALRLLAPAPQGEQRSSVVAERQLRFTDRADGGVNVIDVLRPERSQVLQPGSTTDGFLRATLRTLARERKRQGVDAGPPFLLSALADGRLLLQDPSTGRQVDLEAFGPTNAQRFASLMYPSQPLTKGQP